MAKKRQGSKSSSKARNPRDTEFDVTFEEVKDDHYLDIRTLKLDANQPQHETKGIKKAQQSGLNQSYKIDYTTNQITTEQEMIYDKISSTDQYFTKWQDDILRLDNKKKGKFDDLASDEDEKQEQFQKSVQQFDFILQNLRIPEKNLKKCRSNGAWQYLVLFLESAKYVHHYIDDSCNQSIRDLMKVIADFQSKKLNPEIQAYNKWDQDNSLHEVMINQLFKFQNENQIETFQLQKEKQNGFSLIDQQIQELKNRKVPKICDHSKIDVSKLVNEQLKQSSQLEQFLIQVLNDTQEMVQSIDRLALVSPQNKHFEKNRPHHYQDNNLIEILKRNVID